MAFQVLTAGTILAGKYDISGQLNAMNHLPMTRENLEKTNFASGGDREYVGGLRSAGGAVTGFTSDMTFDASQLTGYDAPITASLTNPLAEGDGIRAYNAIQTQFDRGMTVGQLLAYNGSFVSTSPVARGTALHTGAETATGSGTGQNLGAVSATQKAYAWMHVTAVAGTSPTLDVLVESDASDSWAGAETTRFTFTQETDATSGHQWLAAVSGAITDTWWRVTYTIGGTGSPSFTFVVGLAIQ